MNRQGIIKPLQIGGVKLENNLILAPMAGVSDLPFRLLCMEQGAGLVCMELVSAKAILYKNRNTEELLAIDPNEKCVSLQLFGSDPDIMSEIAKQIEERPFDILDINMGCPVPKVVNNGDGSALMKNPVLAGKIIEKTVRAIKKPVTVKIRKGFDDAHVNAPELAHIAQESGAAAVAVHGRTREQYYAGAADWEIIRKVKENVSHVNAPELAHIAQESGAAAVAVHGRTREQYYAGAADWEIIRKVKENVSIPVLGNGDLKTADDIAAMAEQTGCDGFMIARGAQGNPWIFRQILHYFETGETLEKPSFAEVTQMLLRHAKMQLAIKGDYTGIREIRKHAAWYTAGYRNSSKLRGRINEVESYDELQALFEEVLSYNEEK